MAVDSADLCQPLESISSVNHTTLANVVTNGASGDSIRIRFPIISHFNLEPAVEHELSQMLIAVMGSLDG